MRQRSRLLVAATVALVSWSTDARAQLPAEPPPSTVLAAGPVRAAPAIEEVYAADRFVRVELPGSDPAAALEIYDPRARGGLGDDASWSNVCASPCTALVPSQARLRVNGSFRASAPFSAPDSRIVRLEVDPGRSVWRGVGLGLTVGGGIATLVSGYFAIALRSRGEEDARDGGWVGRDATNVFIGSAIVTGLGVVLTYAHWRTRVTILDRSKLALPLGKGPSGTGMWLGPNGLVF